MKASLIITILVYDLNYALAYMDDKNINWTILTLYENIIAI